ncbi:hypothetical protein [Microcoleus vaginatus]|uniref:hypothetical protein n=1 Tax=Microcoleus vaginatus TaxID=119532 RepID=UPI001686DF23|nr:hypothetical protein [Microcoleus sp. FACHB-84]MBD2011424.1 hypothetical protein [Microcoleus sp. FACHB-45]
MKHIGLVAIAADAVVSKDVGERARSVGGVPASPHARVFDESEKFASPNSNSTRGRFN